LGKEAAATAAAADGEGGRRAPSQLGKKPSPLGNEAGAIRKEAAAAAVGKEAAATASATVGEGFPFFSRAEDEPVRSRAEALCVRWSPGPRVEHRDYVRTKALCSRPARNFFSSRRSFAHMEPQKSLVQTTDTRRLKYQGRSVRRTSTRAGRQMMAQVSSNFVQAHLGPRKKKSIAMNTRQNLSQHTEKIYLGETVRRKVFQKEWEKKSIYAFYKNYFQHFLWNLIRSSEKQVQHSIRKWEAGY
jgi:hypothetical protein